MTEVEARKKAPPEKPYAIRLRTKIILSFWAVILLLGLPTWLKTTEIYRASLPLDRMLALSEGAVSRSKSPLKVSLTSLATSTRTFTASLAHTLPIVL